MVEAAALMPRVIHIPFEGGVRQDVDPAVAPAPGLAAITNGRIPRTGGIVKRLGTEIVPQTVTAGSLAFRSARPNAAANAQGRDLLATGGVVYARDAEIETSWHETGRVSRFLPRKAHFLSLDETASSAVYDAPNIATLSNTICTVHMEFEPGAVQVLVIQLMDPSMQRRFTARVIDRFTPRVFAVGSVYVIAYQSTTAEVIFRALNPATFALSAEVVLANLQTSGDRFDAAPYDSASFLWVGRVAGAPPILRVRRVSLVGATILSRDISNPENDLIYRSRVYAIPGQRVWVAWRDIGTTSGQLVSVADDFLSDSGLQTFGTEVKHFGFTQRTATTVWLVYSDILTAPTTAQTCLVIGSVGSGGVSTPQEPLWNLHLGSNPFDGTATEVAFWCYQQNTADFARRSMLVTVSASAAFGKQVVKCELTSDLEASFQQSPFGMNTTVASVATAGHLRYYATVQTLGSFSANYVYEYEDWSTRRGAWRQIVDVAGAGAALGGHLQELTSDRINTELTTSEDRGFENGFLRAPYIVSITPNPGAGTLPVGLYQIRAVYEYIDADGRRHRSEPSSDVFGGSVNVVAVNSNLEIEVTTALPSEREQSCGQLRGAITIYMTTAGGSTFYRITPDSSAPPSVAPTMAGADSTYTFVFAGPVNTSREQLYTAGGELRNSPAPSHRFGLVAHDALWLAGLWDPRMIERSKTIVPFEPVQFTRADQFRMIAPFDVTALAELDGQILILGPDGLAVAQADGPNDQGVPALAAPTLLSSTGCVSDTSVIRIPQGVLFAGERGIYMVPRGGGEPEFIGSPVQYDMTSAVYAVAVCYEPPTIGVPASRLVAFVYSGNLGSVVAFLDQDSLQWVSSGDLMEIAPEVLGNWGGRLVYLPANPTTEPILRQTTDRTNGDLTTTFTPTGGETVWLRPFDLLGWGYVRKAQLLCTVLSTSCRIRLDVAKDGGGYTGMPTLAPLGFGVQRLEWQLPNDQPCNAVKFRFTDLAADGGGPSAGVIFHGLSIGVDGVEDLARLAAGART
jgi:hypothetical protein